MKAPTWVDRDSLVWKIVYQKNNLLLCRGGLTTYKEEQLRWTKLFTLSTLHTLRIPLIHWWVIVVGVKNTEKIRQRMSILHWRRIMLEWYRPPSKYKISKKMTLVLISIATYARKNKRRRKKAIIGRIRQLTISLKQTGEKLVAKILNQKDSIASQMKKYPLLLSELSLKANSTPRDV